MNPYTTLNCGLGNHEATDLVARLSAWHDAMVAHERRLRAGTTSDSCDDECPHAEARALWAEAVATIGAQAQELAFLRSRAQEARRSMSPAASLHRTFIRRRGQSGMKEMSDDRLTAAATRDAVPP